MTADSLLEFLIAEIEDNNRALVDQLLADARAKIAAGGGIIASITGSTLNGKQFARTVHLGAAEVARICRQAIAAAEGGDVISTALDFSGVIRLY